MRLFQRRIAFCCAALCVLAAGAAESQTPQFGLNRYEPTPAGEWSFYIDHPWYSATRRFAGGLTYNYGHNPLVFRYFDAQGSEVRRINVVSGQHLLHVDLAFSFLNRITVSASLPVVLQERGTSTTGFSPIVGGTVGDPRLGVMVRLHGDPETRPFSVNAGFSLWAPLGISDHAGDSSVRVFPRVVLGGLAHRVRWSLLGGFYVRRAVRIEVAGRNPGRDAGTELQLGGSVYYHDPARRLAIGPEIAFAGLLVGENAFRRNGTSLELLLGLHHNIKRQVMVGIAGGAGFLREPGTPDFRLLFRLAYAPVSGGKPRPQPSQPRATAETCRSQPDLPGCDRILERYVVVPDEDGHVGAVEIDDGEQVTVLDRPNQPLGLALNGSIQPAPPSSDVNRSLEQTLAALPHKPARDRDGDGVPDSEDRCPEWPGPTPPVPGVAPGCPATSERMVVVPDEQGHVGAIEIDSGNKVTVLDQANRPVGSTPTGELAPSELSPRNKAAIDAAMAALPDKPSGDRDRDGVPDVIDRCPDWAGPQASEGCPASRERYVVVPDDRAHVGAIELNRGRQIVVLDKENQPLGTTTQGPLAPVELSPAERDNLATAIERLPEKTSRDRDGDAVLNSEDECPDWPGPRAGERPGCPDTVEHVVVLPDDNGHVGAVAIEDGKHVTVLDQANVVSRINAQGTTPLPPPEGNDLTRFGAALRAAPKPAETFVIYFRTGLELNPGSEAVVARVVKAASERHTYRIEMTGHADRVGAAEKNQRLSEQRAKRVADLVTAAGIPEDLVTHIGRGEAEPSVTTRDNVPELRNRRVVIIVR